ncbi:MAG: VOC family protein [Planctomycetota bacterium]
MKLQGLTPILNVRDVVASRRWFADLGFERGFAWNGGGMLAPGLDENAHGPAHFGSVCSGDFEIFLCRDGQGARDTHSWQGSIEEGGERRRAGEDDTGCVWMSWWLASPAEVDALHARAVELGCEIAHPPVDEPWGVREFHLRHPDGHTFRVSAALRR